MIHFITGEYPPTPGGVADYCAQVAEALAGQGELVHVWAPGALDIREEGGVSVHRVAGRFTGAGLARLDRKLSRIAGPRRLLVQWTPHSFGLRSLNVPFALWVWKRARVDGDRVELMIHEPFVAFGEGSRKQDAAAVVHRLMASLLLRAAAKVWVAIPAWEQCLRPFAGGRALSFEWLPVPSNIQPAGSIGIVRGIRAALVSNGQPLIGHFGTYRQDIRALLAPALVLLLERTDAGVLLVGRGSDDFCGSLLVRCGRAENRVIATGELPSVDAGSHLASCDALLQPYPDGISTRRGTAMAALSLGVPMVTNTGPLSEPFWRTGNVLELAASSSPEHLAAAMQQLLRNAARCGELGKRARRMYAARFDLRHTIARLSDVKIPGAPLVAEAAA